MDMRYPHDGYASDVTVSEHYNQHSEAIQTILKDLDGYGGGGGVTATEGSDGYLAFFTGSDSIAGDNDLSFNRVTHDVTLGGGGNLTLNDGRVIITNSILGGGAATPALALGDGNTGFYETSDNWMGVAVGGAAHSRFRSGRYESLVNGGFTILTSVPSSTSPNLIPNGTDSNTGIGYAGADQLSLIVGGVEGVRVTRVVSVTMDVNGDLEVHGAILNSDLSETFQVITQALDGYALATDLAGEVATQAEHYSQHSETIQTILKDLDGYGGAGGVTATEGSDGYAAFFTGSDSIAGDNDLFWDRPNNRLGVGTTSPQTKLDVAGDITVSGDVDAYSMQQYSSLYLATSNSTQTVLFNPFDIVTNGGTITGNAEQGITFLDGVWTISKTGVYKIEVHAVIEHPLTTNPLDEFRFNKNSGTIIYDAPAVIQVHGSVDPTMVSAGGIFSLAAGDTIEFEMQGRLATATRCMLGTMFAIYRIA
jgi:hypothetical protein